MVTNTRMLQSPQIMPNSATESPPAAPSSRLRLGRRHLWLIPGLVVAVYANAQSAQHGLGLAVLLLFGIVPHLPALLGIGQPHAPGQMARRAVPLFNVMHHPAPPLVFVCRSGQRARQAAAWMRNAGHAQAWHLACALPEPVTS
jgi:rhodanese-related sulfurtransferase